jgi:hypothetical protein
MNDEVVLEIKVHADTAHEAVEETLDYVHREYIGPLGMNRSRTTAISVEEV